MCFKALETQVDLVLRDFFFFGQAVSEVENKRLNPSHTVFFDMENKHSNTELWKEESTSTIKIIITALESS